jgi:hypothetical protein
MSVPVKIYRTVTYQEGQAPSNPNLSGDPIQNPVNPNGGATEELVPYDGAIKNVNLGEFGMSGGFMKYDTTPTGTPTDQGTTYWDVDDNTLAIIMNGAIQKVGEDSFYPVKNQSGSSIAKGTNVRFAGTVGSSGRLLIEPFIANGSVQSSLFMGVTMEEIADGDDGKVMWFGRIRGINTNAFNEGDILYASTTSAGGFQTTIPQAPNNIVQVAAVINKSVNNGVIFVRPTLGSNINKDEGVKIVSPTNGQGLVYNSTSQLWENASVGTLSGSGVAGRIPFWTGTNALSSDGGLLWDDTTKSILVGSVIPVAGYRVRISGGAIDMTNWVSSSGAYDKITFDFGEARGFGYDPFRNEIFIVKISGAVPSVKWNTDANANSFVLTSSSNILIGTDVDAGFKFNVLGTTRLNGLQTFQGTSASDTAPLGSELLTSANWTTTGWTGDFSTGFTHSTGNTTALSNTLAGIIGNYYQISYTLTGVTSGVVTIEFGGQSIVTNGTGAFGPRATTTGNLVVTPTSDFNGTIVLSIKVISVSSATTTFTNSAGVARVEIRATSSGNNTTFGNNSGARITLGTSNSLFGTGAGANITSGKDNSFFGVNAGQATNIGAGNSFFGLQSGFNNTIGTNNSFYGFNSGFNIIDGSQNSFIGVGSGVYIANGSTALTKASNSVFIGFSTKANANNEDNQIVIGANSTGNGANTITIGNINITNNYIQGNFNITDAKNIILGTTTGTKIGTATSQKLGFWNATPIVQPTTSVAESGFVENAGGTAVNDDSTFDGYTLRQIVKALRNAGLLA